MEQHGAEVTRPEIRPRAGELRGFVLRAQEESFDFGATRGPVDSGLAAAAEEHGREQKAAAHDQEPAADFGGSGGTGGAEEP